MPELEEAIQRSSKDQRSSILGRVTDLFLTNADRLTSRQIEVFDDVIGHLIQRIEGQALAELSGRIARIKTAPVAVVRRLARNNDIVIAEPVLTHSRRLSTKDLIEVANTKSQDHLIAISGRAQLDALLTDVLLGRGTEPVMHRLAANKGAHFSEAGFTNLVKHSERDHQLAEKLGLRVDLPLQLFRALLLRSTEAARLRLLALAGPERRDHIQRILATRSEQVGCEAKACLEPDYARARRVVLSKRSKGQLGEPTLIEFARARQHPEVAVVLSVLCFAPLELIMNILQGGDHGSLLVLCKAAGLKWSTVSLLMNGGFLNRAMSEQDVDDTRVRYSGLSQSSAQQVVCFWQGQKRAARAAASSPTMRK